MRFLLLTLHVTQAIQVQGVVNTLGDLRGTLAAVDRVNSILSGTEIDKSLAYGLDREIQENELDDDSLGLLYKDESSRKSAGSSIHSFRSATNGCHLAWSGDICLEGNCAMIDILYIILYLFSRNSFFLINVRVRD